MDSWILLYSRGYKSIITIICFDSQIGPDLASVSPFQLAPVSFYHVPVILGACPYFLTQQDVPGSISTFLTPALVPFSGKNLGAVQH